VTDLRTPVPAPAYALIPREEADIIKQGGTAQWFEQLMDGNMLLMPQRPTLTAPMRARLELQSFRMRTKAASAPREGFYVWFESQKVKDSEFPTDEDVDTSQAVEADDFDPLAEVG